MSSDETLTAPTPVLDSADMQTVSPYMAAEELAYTYQRADGTVERARNAEDAIARCPVLGKLAIEAPDQANVLLELAALGSAKMAAGAKEEPSKSSYQEKLAETKPTKADIESEEKIPEISTEQLISTEVPVIVREAPEQREPVLRVDSAASHHADIQRLEKEREEFLLAIGNAVEPNTNDIVAVSERFQAEPKMEVGLPSELPVTDKIKRVQPLKVIRNESSIVLAPLANSEIEQRRQSDTEIQEVDSDDKSVEAAVYTNVPQDVEVAIIADSSHGTYSEETTTTESYESTAIIEEIAEQLDVEYEAGDIEMALEPDNIEVLDITLNMDNESSTETELDESLAQLFESETIETYVELRDVIAASVSDEDNSTDITELEASEVNESEAENVTEQVDTPTFETFIAAQPVSEEVTLETIKEQSNVQPLGQTLVQLAEYLAESKEDNEQPESLIAIIKDLEKALPDCYTRQEAEEVKLQITPEMTDKLLALLRELGHQNPREALANMIRKFGFEFLIQSLTHIYQLTDEENRKEFSCISMPAFSSDDNSLVRLSKLILKLVMGKELLRESTAT